MTIADDTGSPFEHNGSTPVLINVTSAGQDVVVADSARYYLNSCCPAVHGTKLCELGQMSIASGIPDQELCYYTDIAAFDVYPFGAYLPVPGGNGREVICKNETFALSGRCQVGLTL